MVCVDPNDYFIHVNLGEALREHGEVDEAIKEFREAIRLNPNDGLERAADLGLALGFKEQFDEAISRRHKAIRLWPNDSDVHVRYARTLEAMGKRHEAIAERHAVLGIGPDDPDLRAQTQKELDPAVAEHREATRFRSSDFWVHAHARERFAGSGKLDEAIEEHRTAVLLKANDSGVHSNLAATLEMQGKNEEAIVERRTVLPSNPMTPGHTPTWPGPWRRRGGLMKRSACIGKPYASPLSHLTLAGPSSTVIWGRRS